MTIDPFHRLYLEKHAVDPDLAEKLGVRSITDPDDLPAEFEYLNGQGTPSLLYPWSDGTREWRQLHPDKVPVVDGEERKYVFPWRETPLLWLVHDPARPAGELWVEGTKQALAAASTGIGWRVRAIAGCWSWYSEGAPIPGVYGAADGLDLVVLLDADVDTNPTVWDAGARMLGELGSVAGAASVKIGRVPGGGKSGLDDVLAKAPEAQRLPMLERIVKAAAPKLGTRPRDPDPRVSSGLFTMRPNRSIALLVQNVARELDNIAPWAWQEKGDSLWRYNASTGVYEHVPPRAFEAHLAHLLGNDYEARYARDALGGVKHHAAIQRRVIDPTAAPSRKVAVANGVLDPKTGVLEEHSPDHLLLGAWATPYDETAECPRILAYLEEQFPGQADVILDTAARMLNRVDPQDRTLFLFGPPRSGKSTVVRLLEAVTGSDACSHVSIHQLASRPFASAGLFGKSLNTFADLSSAEVQDTSIFKALTGGDAIDAERKHEHAFQFTNRALLVFSANEVPALPADSEAEFARFVPVKAGRSFLGEEDPAVEAALMEELPGLLAELVRRYRAGRMPAPSPEVRDEFRLAGDKVARYIAQRLDPWPVDAPWKGAPRGSTVHADFQVWCQAEGVKALSASRFYAGLAKNGVATGLKDGVRRVKATIRGGGDGALDLDTAAPDSGETDETGGGGASTASVSGPSGLPDDLRAYARREVEDESSHGEVSCAEAPSPHLAPPLVFDLETGGIEALWSSGPEYARIVGRGPAPVTVDTDMAAVVAHPGPLVAHNGFQFDFHVLARHGLTWDRELIDTKVLAALHDPPPYDMPPRAIEKHYSLDRVAERMGLPRKTDDIVRLAKKHGGFDRIPVDDPEYVAYCAGDVEATQAILDALPLTDYARREFRLLARLAQSVTGIGFRVDVDEVRRRYEAGLAKVSEGRDWLVDHYGLPTTRKDGGESASPQATEAGRAALTEAFRAVDLDPDKWPRDMRTKKGVPSFGQASMRRIAEHRDATPAQRELAATVLGMNGVRTVYGTVLDNLHGDRVHPTVSARQASGRLSITNPGLTVFGKRQGRWVERQVFLPEEGHVIVPFDLDQVDARAVAALCQDPAYMALFTDPDVDSHEEVAFRIWGVRDGKGGTYRERAKAIGHAWNYGAGIDRITRETGLPREDIEKFDAGMRSDFPLLVEWKDAVRAEARTGSLLDNGFGRKMRPDPDRAWTQGPALMGQGAARDLMMGGILRLPDEVVPMLRAVVHDEIVLSIPAGDVVDVSRAVVEALTTEWRGVPITTEAGKPASTWGDCYRKD